MNLDEKFLWFFGAIAVLLAIASVIGRILAKRAKTESSMSTIENLNQRVNAWWGMVIIFFVSYLLGGNATVILFGFISLFALREFITLTPTRLGDHNALFSAFFILIPLQYVLIGTHWYSLFTLLIPVYAFLLLPAIAVLSQDTDAFLERAAKIQWGVMICVYCISHAPALLLLDLEGFKGQNALLLFYLVFVVQLSDVLQYVFGKLFGKHKVAPLVSPSKTVEGLVGGGLSATLIGGCMFWMTPFSFWQSLLMSLVIVVMGFLGGLVMSAIKRSLSAKDWGTMIKGHGGMLDRMDSICFAAPIFFHLTRYFFSAP
ncbi:MAG: phosphatidate cytidylyltransferase [Pseudomonas sp.]|jgi:phosphatidate cytidylyltransferase|uniref:phosphatidate cytidylyltransferase n=1 Tax=Pseudomonas TaxID=286 RepID=UPI00190C4A24|nr:MULTISPECIES: phosphatidate cytidylyltransferase [Pseudomonas]MDF9880343.1 phosphatidate cytidylyltransferase [Pseudomonas silensiensis]MDO8406820.1 phosphatidate cytidylyltransferase [Pseudomonas sp.]MDO9327448.1 phosphatidate cytidylyltransferase [Pseudomonas sp.]QQN96800.1 phosphatidate cytidylyltransferase [Pseudomonas sp. SW-3]QZA95825.1 phosphatidate cytidylyltransferase [Pseudomonas mandelii]